MVNETALITAEQAKAGRLAWLQTGATQSLLRFLVVVGLLCAALCLYFTQANSIDDIRVATRKLNVQAGNLERENSSLMTQVAAWNRPDNIRNRASGQGMVPAGRPAYVQIASPDGASASTPHSNDLAGWWQQLVGEVARQWSGVTQTADLSTASR